MVFELGVRASDDDAGVGVARVGASPRARGGAMSNRTAAVPTTGHDRMRRPRHTRARERRAYITAARDAWERILRAVRHESAIVDAGVDGVVLGLWEGALDR